MRRKMIITNKTDFDTRNLRSIILAVARRHLKANEYPTLKVTIGHPKMSHVTGNAIINRIGCSTGIFSIFIPKDHVDVLEVCQRILICFDYIRGNRGAASCANGVVYRDWYHYKGRAADFPFAKRMALVKEKPKSSIKPTGAVRSLKKAEYAQEKVHYWERKLKYATTMLKKWRKQLNYHANRGDKLRAEEAVALENNQGMTVEDFLKMPPIKESGDGN